MSKSQSSITKERNITVHDIEWQSVRIQITWEPDYLDMLATYGTGTSHLQIKVLGPFGAQLPITETGYLSHFGDPAAVLEAGGPVRYVLAWLDHTAKSPQWRAHCEANSQMSLF